MASLCYLQYTPTDPCQWLDRTAAIPRTADSVLFHLISLDSPSMGEGNDQAPIRLSYTLSSTSSSTSSIVHVARASERRDLDRIPDSRLVSSATHPFQTSHSPNHAPTSHSSSYHLHQISSRSSLPSSNRGLFLPISLPRCIEIDPRLASQTQRREEMDQSFVNRRQGRSEQS